MKGNISLSTVLITSSILLLSGAVLIFVITDFANSSRNVFNNELNEIQAKACVEESLHRIKTNLSYEGTFSININSGNCSITIDINNSNSNFRDINVISNLNSLTTSKNVRLDISQSPFVLTNL
jgi:hypothetical protein